LDVDSLDLLGEIEVEVGAAVFSVGDAAEAGAELVV
jgi:hypothetical protein